jgi:hypothetical protein
VAALPQTSTEQIIDFVLVLLQGVESAAWQRLRVSGEGIGCEAFMERAVLWVVRQCQAEQADIPPSILRGGGCAGIDPIID